LIILAPSDIFSSVSLENDSSNKSNRLCLISEKFNILKNFKDALQSLKQSIELDAKNSTALNLLGAIMNEQSSSDCIKYYEKCLEINKRSYLSYNGLGNYYLKTNQFQKAEECYTKAIKINPKRSAKIYKNRAYLKEKQNKNSDAKEDLQTYLKYSPKASDRGIIEQAIREL